MVEIDREAFRMLATLTGSTDVGSRGAVSVNRDPLIPERELRDAAVRDRADVEATEAERVERRDEGGA